MQVILFRRNNEIVFLCNVMYNTLIFNDCIALAITPQYFVETTLFYGKLNENINIKDDNNTSVDRDELPKGNEMINDVKETFCLPWGFMYFRDSLLSRVMHFTYITSIHCTVYYFAQSKP